MSHFVALYSTTKMTLYDKVPLRHSYNQGEMAGTRAGGIHRVGAYAQHERRRGLPVEWEAGDVKRSRAAGVAQQRDADGARRKADGTLDRRYRANRGAPP